MKVAFIGGTRFIGRAAAERAVHVGHDVFLLHRGVHPNDVEGAESITVDRSDTAALRAALQQVGPHVVIDTRAFTRAEAEHSVKAIQGMGCHVVVLSSQDVYAQFGRLNGLPAPDPESVVMEDSPLTDSCTTDRHKRADEYDKREVESVFQCAVRSAAVASVTALRLPATFGRNDYQRRFGDIIDCLDADEVRLPCVDGGRWRWTHGHVSDVAHAVVLAATKPVATFVAFNVGEAETPTMRERVEMIASQMKKEPSWYTADDVPNRFALLRRMPNDFIVDTGGIRKSLDYSEITSPQERIADLVAWVRHTRNERLGV